MKDGFIKIAVATPDIKVADCGFNARNIIKLMNEANRKGVKILCFPELCITAYTCGDLFLQESLQEGALKALSDILKASEKMNMAVALGSPIKVNNKLYNTAILIFEGKILGVVPKRHLPNYTEFYEQRWFYPGEPDVIKKISLCGQYVNFGMPQIFKSNVEGLCLGIEICEDLWVADTPGTRLSRSGATVILNLSASDELVSKADYRRELVSSASARLLCTYLYADAGEGESSTDLVFGAHDIIAENGSILIESRFKNGLFVTETDVQKLSVERMRMNTFDPLDDPHVVTTSFDFNFEETVLTRFYAANPFVPTDHGDRNLRCEEILNIASLGLKKRISHTGSKKILIGLSGGLDSTLALLIIIRTLNMLNRPALDVIACTMPCFGTTDRTKINASRLANILGAKLKVINIKASVSKHFEDIGLSSSDRSNAYENAQARERTQVLMDLANMLDGLVVGTGDLSELALGWSTYNGDHMSMYGVNASIPKTLVKYLVRFIADEEMEENPELSRILYDILDTPISPELLPSDDGTIAQKTEEIVGPYELNDFFLYYVVRFGFNPVKIYRLAKYALGSSYKDDEILRYLKNFYKRFFSQQFKRSCLPDGPKVGTVSLSPRGDLRMPSDAMVSLWMDEISKLK